MWTRTSSERALLLRRGQEVAIVAGVRMDAADIGLQGIEPRRPFGGGVCEQGFYKARVDSVVRVLRPVESDPRLRGLGPMSDGPVENRWDSEKSQTAFWLALFL